MAPLNKTAFHFSQRSDLMDFLLELSTRISRTLDLESLMETIVDIISQVVPGTLVGILLYDEERRELRLRYGKGHREEHLRSLAIPLGQGLTGMAGKERKSVVVGDVRSHPNYLATVDAVRSEIAVPMEVGGKLVGVIDVQSTELDAYGAYDERLLSLLASRIASAVENATLFEQADRQNKMLQLLAEISTEIGSLLDLDALLERVAATLSDYIGYASFNLFLVDEHAELLRHRFSLRDGERVEFDNIPLDRGITGAAYRSRQLERVADTAQDSRFIETAPDVRSEIAVPLIVKDAVIAVLDLESEQLNHFTAEHTQLLRLLAPQLAISVENATLYERISARERTMENDLEAAKELQSFLLPRIPPRARGLEIDARLQAARTVSGDLYDLVDLDDGGLLFAVGDVSGKGAAAALYGAMVSGLLRTIAPAIGRPGAILKALNDALAARRVHARYVTMTLAQWRPEERILRLANSGGIPPLVLKGDRLVNAAVEGVPLGLLPALNYDELEIPLDPGDVVLLFSDGIPDQTNPGEQEFGITRVSENLVRLRRQSVQQIAGGILDAVAAFANGAVVFDDQTLIVMRVSE
ncbi:MAG: SpoIIE family protein phosphatase [Bryobacterales bacterium]|nr:SpoIIE family protein phosphatase [Bryobacterales bacterium]